MRLGIIAPLWEPWPRQAANGAKTQRWVGVRDMARAAEEARLDSFWIRDHLLGRREGWGEIGCWEGLTVAAAVASCTTRITVGTLVACTAFRNPALLAKMAENLDEISAGRFVLGLGCGWNKVEFAAFGYPFERRVDRFEEALQVIVPLLREGRVTFSGQHQPVIDAVLRPRGPSGSGPPIWIGAKRPRMVRLAARYADAWNADWIATPKKAAELRQKLEAACADVGRDPSTLSVSGQVRLQILSANETADPDAHFAGPPSQIGKVLRAYADSGLSHLAVELLPSGASTVTSIGALGTIWISAATA